MSSIDNRVVKMSFDNAEFERKAGTTLGTLEKLKQALSFEGMVKGLQNLKTGVSQVSFESLLTGVDAINNRFSVLGEFAHNTLMNIVNTAVNAGKQIADALVIDPVKEGFAEYELQMNSIQTIMAATGEDLATVNAKLNELNDYADKTIYSFSDMTNNIGKFTNAGIGLDESVAAIQGISNAAALAGAGTRQASSAMLNFSQALSAGYLGLVDWKSINLTAQMGTEKFRQMLIDTGVAMGTLIEQNGKYISTTTDLTGKISDEFEAFEGFDNSLRSQWANKEVITQALINYGTDIRELTETEQEAYRAQLMSIYGDEQKVQSIIDLGIAAADASKDVKTFTQLIDTLKEALGTGWAKTWEYIIGDFEQAKALWTEVSETLTGYINASSDIRNALFESWSKGGGREAVIDGLRNAFDGLLSVVKPIKSAFSNIFPAITSEELIAYSDKFKEFTNNLILSQDQQQAVQQVATKIFHILKDGFSTIVTIGSSAASVLKAIASGLSSAFDIKVLSNIDLFVQSIKNFFDSIKPSETVLSNFQRLFEGIGSIFRSLITVATNLGRALFDNLGVFFKDISPDIEKFMDALGGIGDKLKDFAQKIETELSYDTFASGVDRIREAISNLFDIVKSNVDLPGVLTKLFDYITGIDLSGITNGINGILEGASGVTDILHNIFTNLGGEDGLFANIVKGFKSFLDNIDWAAIFNVLSHIETFLTTRTLLKMVDWLEKLPDTVGDIAGSIGEVFGLAKRDGGAVKQLLQGVKDVFVSWQQQIKTMTILEIAVALSQVADALLKVSQIPSDRILPAFTYLAGGITALNLAAKGLSIKDLVKVPDLTALAFAIGIMADSLVKLSKVDPERMLTGIGGFILMVATVTAALERLSKIKVKKIAKMGAVGTAMIEIAIAIEILAFAVKKLSKIDADKLALGLSGVVILMGGLVAAIDHLAGLKIEKAGSLVAVSAAMILIATAVGMLAGSVKKLAKLDPLNMVIGLSAVIILLGGLVGALDYLSRIKFENVAGIVAVSAALILIAAAVGMLAGSVKKLAGLDADNLVLGLSSVIILIGGLVAALEYMNNIKLEKVGSIVAVSAAMILIAEAISILSKSLVKIGSLDLGQMVQGLIAVIAMLGVLVLVVKELSQFKTDDATSILLVSSAMVVMAVAIKLLASAVVKLGSLNLEQMAIGLLGMVGSLYAMVTALFMLSELDTKGIMVGAAAVLVMAAAIAILAPAITMLSTMNIGGLVIALTALAGAFILFATIASASSVTSAALLAFAGAIALVGVGIFALASGISIISQIIANTGPQTSQAIQSVLQVLIDALPKIGELFVGMLTLLFDSLIATVDKVVELVVALGSALITGLTELIPQLLELMTTIFTGILDVIVELAPKIAESLLSILTNLLQQLATYVPQMADAGLKIILGLLDAIANNIQKIVEAGISIVVNFIRGVSSKLGEVIDAAFKLIISFINGLADAIRNNNGDLWAAAGNLIMALVEALLNGLGEIINVGAQLMQGFINGIGGFAQNIWNTACQLGRYVWQGLKNFGTSIYNAGVNLIQGFINGIASGAQALWDTCCNLARDAWAAITGTLDEHSPSRLTFGGGVNFVLGFINGINSIADKSASAAAGVAKTALDAINSVGMLDASPTITPVLDLSEIQNGIGNVDALFESMPSAYGITGTINAQKAQLQTTLDALGRDADYTDIISSISSLRNDFTSLTDQLMNTRIVMDSGALVGAIAPNMDHALGRRQMMAERGVY